MKTTSNIIAPFNHVTDIRAEYQSRRPQGHFFDPGTMRFFKSRVCGIVTQTPDAVYFLTSEKGPHANSPRRYSARVMALDGDIETIGEFNKLTRRAAEKLAYQAADRNLTAKELGNGGLAIKCILDAKKYFEEDGGTISARCATMRANAEHWAAEARWRIEWTSITPHIHRQGRDYMIADLLPFVD